MGLGWLWRYQCHEINNILCQPGFFLSLNCFLVSLSFATSNISLLLIKMAEDGILFLNSDVICSHKVRINQTRYRFCTHFVCMQNQNELDNKKVARPKMFDLIGGENVFTIWIKRTYFFPVLVTINSFRVHANFVRDENVVQVETQNQHFICSNACRYPIFVVALFELEWNSFARTFHRFQIPVSYNVFIILVTSPLFLHRMNFFLRRWTFTLNLFIGTCENTMF